MISREKMIFSIAIYLYLCIPAKNQIFQSNFHIQTYNRLDYCSINEKVFFMIIQNINVNQAQRWNNILIGMKIL